MSFSYDLSDELRALIPRLSKRNKQLVVQLNNKIDEIVACDEFSIDHYKNLRHDLSGYKRVHVGGSFVLFFRVFKKEKFVLFEKLVHHDEAYRR